MVFIKPVSIDHKGICCYIGNMKTKNMNFAAIVCFLGLLTFFASSSGPALGAEENPVMEMRQAARELQQAGQEFSSGQGKTDAQRNGATTASSASQQAGQTTQGAGEAAKNDPRDQALQGSPETGYAGTWTDPANGDIVTSVIAPVPQPSQNNQNYPIIIEPQVSGGGYSGSYNGYNAYNGWNNGPQWPTTPDNPGYPPSTGTGPYPGYQPYYPGQPYPGYNPYPGMAIPYPGYNPAPGYPYPMPPFAGHHPGWRPPANFHPGYRPLRPHPNPGVQPGNPGMHPGNPGFPPGNPGGANPPQNPNPGGLWNPGNAPQPPAMRPLPMRPAGNSWHASPFSGPARGGLFGTPGSARRGEY